MTTYHFIVTLTWPNGPGMPLATLNGTVTLKPGATRGEAYEFVLNLVREQNSQIPRNANVLFFDLAPNDLALG